MLLSEFGCTYGLALLGRGEAYDGRALLHALRCRVPFIIMALWGECRVLETCRTWRLAVWRLAVWRTGRVDAMDTLDATGAQTEI